MKEAFLKKTLSAASQKTVAVVNAILAEYDAEGYDLSLRQLYYQMVARGYVENSQKSYKCLGDLVSNARLVGLIDWEMIKDRGRETITPPHWDSPAEIVRAAAQSFALDKWEDQPHYVEVMVEKQALEGVLIPVCQALDVRFTANKGYSSSSALYETGKRLKHYADQGKCVWLLYLGDHDPSGIDMTRDINDRCPFVLRDPRRGEPAGAEHGPGSGLEPTREPGQDNGQPERGVHPPVRGLVMGTRCP